jgi:PIN domain nuclease of toxin-antitoxin system
VKLLLDTHIWLWSLLEPARLVPDVFGPLGDAASELWLSPISVWEAIMLARKGRLALDAEPATWVERELELAPLRDAPLTRQVAVMSRSLDLAHEDPADRFIAATAMAYGLTLVTADERLQGASQYDVLANRP